MQDAIILYENGKAIGGEGHPTDADDITFNNTGTDIEANKVGSAIKEVNAKSAKSADLTSISESGATASQAISIGTYFYLNGTLCKAKTDIANGATFTEGTNYTVVNGGLNDLKEYTNKVVDLTLTSGTSRFTLSSYQATVHEDLAYISAYGVTTNTIDTTNPLLVSSGATFEKILSSSFQTSAMTLPYPALRIDSNGHIIQNVSSSIASNVNIFMEAVVKIAPIN